MEIDVLPAAYTARTYEPADFLMVEAWWSSHETKSQLVEAMLPPVGIVVEHNGEPVAALWCHLSAGVGVAFLENPVTRPGLSLTETALAFSYALGAIEEICRAHDYGVLIVNTLPQIARWLRNHHGFSPAGERVQLMKVLNDGN